jgi:GT2 family glycosyltransferase
LAAEADVGLVLISAGANIGFAAGNNLAANRAQGEWLALLNPDAYADPDWLEKLVEAASRWPQISSFASLQKAANRPGRLDGAGDVLTLSGFPYRGGYGHNLIDLPEGEVFSACGAAHFIRRDLFLALGGFDERFFCYCEDVDLGYRMRLIGETTLFVPDAVVSHVGSAVMGPRSEFALYHGARNRFWLLIKNTPWPLAPLVGLLHLPVLALMLVIHGLRGEASSVLRGIWAAIVGMGPICISRRPVQARRSVGSLAILIALASNPLALLRRSAHIRPLVNRKAKP